MKDKGFIQWLLNAQTPSIRYQTLRRLLGRPETDTGVQAVRSEMETAGPIPAILAQQTQTGNWSGERSYYTPKYTSTHWSMLLLAELEANSTDPRLRLGATFMLADTKEELEQNIDKGTHGLSCFWGNLVRYVLNCGQNDSMELLVRYLVHDALEAGWRCPYNDEQPCAWGAARALWGLAALPDRSRSPHVNEAIQKGLTFLLETHSLVDANYPTPKSGQTHPLWFRLNFPLFYQADILFVLRVMAELGVLDHQGAQPALAWLDSKRGRNGRWQGANPYRQRTWKSLGDRRETNRWVSLQAALISK